MSASWTRRQVLGAGAALALGSGCSVLPLSRSTPTPTVSFPSTGTWIITRDGNFFSFDLASRQETQITHFSNALASSPALSPNRQRVAYTYYPVPTDPHDLGGVDLYVMNPDGTGPQRVRAHGESGNVYLDPSWSPDGETIYAAFQASIVVGGQAVGQETSIVRVPLTSGGQTTITRGQSPMVSPDGKTLAFLTTDTLNLSHLWLSDLAGNNAREPLANKGFTTIQAPRFSPDGQLIAFAAAGGPAPNATEPPSRDVWVADLLLPSVAEADGTPMDIWVVQPDGSGLRRLTSTLDHNPFPAWSPDGRFLAVAGELNLAIVDVTAAQLRLLASDAKATGVIWLN